MEESTKNAVIKGVVLMVLAAFVVFGLFMLFTRNSGNSNSEGEDIPLTEVQKITTIDLSKSYPQTPAEVSDLYLKIMQVMYKQSYTDDEFNVMANVMAGIFDDELKAQQTNWPEGLRTEVNDRKEGDYSIPVYNVNTNDARMTTDKGDEISNVSAKVVLRHGTSSSDYAYLFILRKDSAGLWKILGWTSQEEAKKQ